MGEYLMNTDEKKQDNKSSKNNSQKTENDKLIQKLFISCLQSDLAVN